MAKLLVTSDASMAAWCGQAGMAVAVVDVIDMSTTLEGVLEEGAVAVFGASPANFRAPVPLNPYGIGEKAGIQAVKANTGIIIIAEPRVGDEIERQRRIQPVVDGINAAGGRVINVVPNIGKETVKLTDFKGKVVVAVTDSGGVAFDAAVTAGAPEVFTVTVARTVKSNTKEVVEKGLARVKNALERHGRVALVAASGRSIEDVEGAFYYYRLALERYR
ncbi:hypothetical protein ciss_15670 [Carboxydothermus islandicus]|uniref:Uncharacterized protein n=1 Tax=Carboxydothermus islandicus TaxID=661089 RepID=A0A1L8D3F6_9THEO|nr:hypothetical protein [Carboxydothermus islandicus]GAV25634.1 hypothetical protein ciss_15670 [Carboxydothermus islandicus]